MSACNCQPNAHNQPPAKILCSLCGEDIGDDGVLMMAERPGPTVHRRCLPPRPPLIRCACGHLEVDHKAFNETLPRLRCLYYQCECKAFEFAGPPSPACAPTDLALIGGDCAVCGLADCDGHVANPEPASVPSPSPTDDEGHAVYEEHQAHLTDLKRKATEGRADETDPYFVLAFAKGAIIDAIGLEDGLDGAAGQAVIAMIDASLAARPEPASVPPLSLETFDGLLSRYLDAYDDPKCSDPSAQREALRSYVSGLVGAKP